MVLLKKIPFYLLFLAVFFCLHGVAENVGLLTVREVLLTGISVAAFIAVAFTIFYFFQRDTFIAGTTVFFISLWFFFFGAIHDFIKTSFLSYLLQRYIVLLPLLIIATVFFLILMRRNKQHRRKLTLYLNILLLIYCITDGGRIIWSVSTTFPAKAAEPFNYAAVHQKPDVYFLVFDSYPGNKSLADSFGYDNSRLEKILVKDSLVSLPVTSNYDLTVFSMSSVLNMNYLDKPWHLPVPDQKDIQTRMREIKDAAVFDYFRNMGYDIKNNSIFDIQDMPGISDANSFLLGHNALLTDKILINRINRDIGDRLPDVFVKNIPFLRDQSFYSHRENNLRTVKNLLDGLKAADDRPVFNYTHLLIPHAPYYFDSTGKAAPFSKISTEGAWDDRNAFISYLKYGTDVADQCLTAIRKARPNAILILMSDHGFRYYNKDTTLQPAKFDNIYAVHFPGGNYGNFPQKLTGVNFFRYLFNSCFGQRFSYLRDAQFTIDY